MNFPAWMEEAFRSGGGKISVETFMRLALYEPGHGYYAQNITTVGRRGDFSTSSTLHRALGQAIAKWCRERELIEIGGGDGALAESLLAALGWLRRRKLRYHLVETSDPLRAQQQARLKRFGRQVVWHRDIGAALQACDGCADIFSNELVDAFPAVLLRWNRRLQRWDEAFVRSDGSEQFDQPTSAPDWPWVPPDAQRCEWHRSYRDWLAGWVPSWRRGRLLTIDYGGAFPDLYHRRPGGSLRAYFAQMRFDGMAEFFQRAGRQDLTADVNFSDLQTWGEELALRDSRLRSQREFLLEQLPDLERRAATDPALDFLLHQDGAGEAFLVLEQTRAK